MEHIDRSISQPLIILKMAADKDQFWTQIPGTSS